MLLPAGIPAGFSAVFGGATDANVAMTVFDVTASPSVAQAAAVMTPTIAALSYFGRFTPQPGKIYQVFIAVYTDDTFATVNDSYEPVFYDVTALYFNPPVQDVVGIVECGVS